MFFRVLFAVGSIRFHLSNGTFPHVSKPPSVVAQLTEKTNFPHHIKFDKRAAAAGCRREWRQKFGN